MNPNYCPGFILEDTFNSDHNQKVLAVALSAPRSTCPLGESMTLVWLCRCMQCAYCIAEYCHAQYRD